jgi:translation initiation factor IF-3
VAVKQRDSERRRVDRQIRASSVRVISADGANLGIRSLDDAMALAHDAGLHLVEVSGGDVPVARICDPGKLAYEEAVHARQRRRDGKGQHGTRSHEVKLRPQTAEGDLGTKLGAARRFLDRGDQVRIVVMLRGRQIGRDGDADGVVERIRSEFADIADIDGPHRAGRDVRLTLRPTGRPAS